MSEMILVLQSPEIGNPLADGPFGDNWPSRYAYIFSLVRHCKETLMHCQGDFQCRGACDANIYDLVGHFLS